MNRSLAFVLCVFICSGCHRESVNDDPAEPFDSQASRRAADFSAARVTNRFGMTFCLVSVDQNHVGDAEGTDGVQMPQKSFYLQQTELTHDQFSAYRDVVARQQNGKEGIADFPMEWRDVQKLSVSLSDFDPDYEYRLPTRDEWSFACMNGYDQDCPGRIAKWTIQGTKSKRPNKFGIEGFMNYDAECSNTPGLFLGMKDNVSGAFAAECQCHQFVYGNPDADDGLNELITARFVLVPRSTSTQP